MNDKTLSWIAFIALIQQFNHCEKKEEKNCYIMCRVMRKLDFAYAKTKTQISFAVTAKLISAFVFATRIVQSLFYLNPKFHGSNHLVWLYSPVCVRLGRKPRRPVFSQRGSYFKFSIISVIETRLVEMSIN